MLTKKQLKIFNVFAKSPFKEQTFKDIKELLKEKSNSIVQSAVKSFLKEKLITERKIGNQKLYGINHENDKSYAYFEILNREMLPNQALIAISNLRETLERHTSFYSIVIFGSFAGNEQKKDSDLDIVVFIEQESKRKIIEAVFKSMELKSLIKIDGHALTKDEFLKMLKVDYENLGKEIARKHMAVYNSAIFYALLKRGVKDGFKL